MNFRLQSLKLYCRQSEELIDFSPQITFFHGKISAGKSSIARLIDFCLGGNLERTPAIAEELVAVELSLQIGMYDVLLERPAQGSNQIQVTWRTSDGEGASVLAPLHTNAASAPIWGDSVYSFTDLMFFLLGVTPMKVRRSKSDQESPLVRLSFRDILWYCYLEQDHLDSSFYNLEDPFRRLKSRDVMRFVVGYYTERLSDLEIQLEEAGKERRGKIEAAAQIRSFLQKFGYGTELEIQGELSAIRDDLRATESELLALRSGEIPNAHVTDVFRRNLRALGDRLDGEAQALADQNELIREQETLRAELLSTKFKLARVQSASVVLAGVSFRHCPSCGTELDENGRHKPDICHLCGSLADPKEKKGRPTADFINRDLDSRLHEVTESIARHIAARQQQLREVDVLTAEKVELDSRLAEELKRYDSVYLARASEAERRAATLIERELNLQKLLRLPEAVANLETEADALKLREERLRREILEERKQLTTGEHYISLIESAYLHILLEVGVPGVQPDDVIRLSRSNWIPSVLKGGDDSRAWDFYNAGSGGKKTLLNVCYALAVHKVAAEHKLPLPTLLIVDSPMKNIGEDVNEDLFQSFYKCLYGLAATSLSETQFVIVDKEYIQPAGYDLDVIERYMTPSDDDHPPLISYYRGP